MGSSHGAALHIVQEGQNGNGQGGAFGWICTGTELVKETKRAAVCLSQNMDNICHVGREGTEALFNALLITNVCKYFFKNRQLRAVKGWNMKTCLSHKGKKADCF